MKKGILIVVLITLSLILFKPPKIYATSNPGWASEIPALGRADIKECSDSTECSTTKTTYTDYFESPVLQRAFVTHNEWSMTIGKNGYTIISPYSTKENYLYSAMYYVCYNKNIDVTNSSIFATYTGNSVNSGNLYNSVVGRSALGTEPIIDGGRKFGRCYIYNAYFVPEMNYNWVGLRIQSDTLVSGVYASVIGLDVRELGLWDEKFIELINKSGLASAESVEQVQQSVDRVEEAITGDYEYNNTPNEDLEGKEELDNLKDKEEELLGNLDFSGVDNLEITIEPETTSFIWQIVDSLRSMSGKIVLLITSILGLGIIKMILNR